MFLVVTRNFPPDIGGIQELMGGLSKGLLVHGPVKVFADEFPNSAHFDKNSEINIERIKGVKLFRKYRKANLVNNFIKENSNIRALFLDHWKSLELLNEEYLKKLKTICLIHSKEINHIPDSRINKRLIKSASKANFIVANSYFTKKLAIKVGIDPSKIKVIFPGIQKPKNIEKKFTTKAEEIFKNSFPKIVTVARL
jgi:phosphatidylinositol alpha-1,6-mannosyltransferase